MIYVDKKLYVGHPRTFSEEIEAALIREYHHAKVVNMDVQAETVITSIRNPFCLIWQWFEANPGWNDFLKFIAEYEHSHFLREGKILWNATEDRELVRDEDVLTDLESLGLPLENLNVVYPAYREHYGPDEVEAVKDKFGDELDRFDYSF